MSGVKTGSAAAGMLLLLVGFTLRHRGAALIAQLLADAIAVAVTYAMLQLGRKRLRFVLDASRLVFVGRFRRRQIFANSEPGKVVELTVVLVGRATMPFWSLVDAAGICEVTVNAEAFEPARLEELRNRLAIPREIVGAPIKAREARHRYPGLVPWWVAHLVIVYFAAFVLLCVVVGILTA